MIDLWLAGMIGGYAFGGFRSGFVRRLASLLLTYGNDELVGTATAFGIVPDLQAALEDSTIARFLMSTTVPLVLTILGPLLPPDITSVADLLPND